MQVILARFTQLLSVTLVGLLTAPPASAWWETGHRTVARIAAAHLTSAARARIAQILNVPDTPKAVADALALASTWADETKSQTHTGAWHYTDLAIQDTLADLPARCHHDNCATERVRIFSHPKDLDQLRYLVHLVGDLHQPLHAISDAELGSNCEHLSTPVDTPQNLHSVSDGAIVNSLGLSDRALAASLNQKLSSFGKDAVAELAAGDATDWTWESHELAIRLYRELGVPVEPVIFPKNCREAPAAVANLTFHLDPDYLQQNQWTVREQLLKAGLRLAKLLNES